MHSLGRAVLSVAALVLGGASAFAADLYGGSLKDEGSYQSSNPGRPALFYLRGDFSAASSGLGTITENPNFTEDQTHIDTSRSWGGGLGMYFSQHVRGDLTLDLSNAAGVNGTLVNGGATVEGTRQFGVKHVLGLANLYYDFGDRGSRFSPYLGVGLGFSRNTTTAGSVDIAGCDAIVGGVPNCAASMDGVSKTNAAGALMAGFTTHLGGRWSLDAGYRFVYLGDAATSDIAITRVNPALAPANAPNSTPAVEVHDLYDNEFRIGARMDLR